MPRHAYTLVEVLVVTMLLGMVSSLGMPPLLRAITDDPLARGASQLARSFRDLRAQAYGQRLSLELEGWGFRAAAVQDGVRTDLATARLPTGVSVVWTRDGRPLRQLELDPRGHGRHAVAMLRHEDRQKRFTVDGLTGEWLESIR